MNRRFNSVRLGNSEIMRGDELNEVRTLVRADLVHDGSPEWSAGSWVVSLRGQPTFTSVAGVDVAPLKARILIGTGGSVQQVECDAVPGFTLQIPASFIDVSLFWEPLPDDSASTASFALPDTVKVKGSVQRGAAVTSARRSFLLPLGPLSSGSGKIPPFAQSWNLYGDLRAALYQPAADYRLHDLGTGDIVLGPFDGLDALAQIKRGSEFLVTGGAASWEATLGNSGDEQSRMAIDFAIRL